MRLFTEHRNFVLGCALMLLTGVVLFGTTLYLPLFQQAVQHASAANSGPLLMPLMVPVVVMSQVSGTLARTIGGSIGLAVFGSLFTRLAGAGTTPEAVTAATHRIFLIAALLSAAALIASLAPEEVPLRGRASGDRATREPAAT